MAAESFQKNVIANYISTAYVTIIGVAIVPVYLEYMGAEAYGLIAFFTMIQTWFGLLDMGLTPTVAHETARMRGGVVESLLYRRLLRALELVFFAVAFTGGSALFLLGDVIAHQWLSASALSGSELTVSLNIMAIIVAMRWLGGLYRGVITGAENLVWLSGCNSLIATLRFICVIPLIILVDSGPVAYFLYQLAIAVIELTGLALKAYKVIPLVPDGESIGWDLTPVKPVLKFSLTIAFTSSVWIFVTQTDKLILSKLLTLSEYGYFVIAVLVAGVVQTLSGPVANAVMPRLTKLQAEEEFADLIKLYRNATQFVCLLAGAASIALGFSAEPLVWLWTGDRLLAEHVAPILRLYAFGNGLLAVAAFPYYLQYAKGDLRLHLIGNAAFVTILLPTIFWAATNYGGVGAGYVWLGINAVSLFAWLPFVHRKFAPGLNFKWYVEDVFSILFPMLFVGFVVSGLLFPEFDGRLHSAMKILILGCAIGLVGAVSSSACRRQLAIFLKRYRTA